MTAWDQYLLTEMRGLALKSDGNLYPSIAAVLGSLDWLMAHDVVVLGFDGLNTDGSHVVPSLAHIADFSSLKGDRPERVQQSIDATRKVLGEWIGHVQFVDLVVEDVND